MSMFSVVSSPTISLTPSSSFSGRLLFLSHPPSKSFLLLQNRFKRCHVKCSYSGTNIDYSNSATIDVTADVKSEKLVVVGGSGFVGSAICKAAVSKGIEVVSLSRSGRPRISESWVDQLHVCRSMGNSGLLGSLWPEDYLDSYLARGIATFLVMLSCVDVLHGWFTTSYACSIVTVKICGLSWKHVSKIFHLTGDVFYANWDEILVGATAVASTLGGFGNEEQLKRINGEANIAAVTAAKDYGVPKFILISIHDYNLPPFLRESTYFTAKRKAESEILSRYPNSGVILRPGFIYGKRRVDGFEVPLDLVMEPWEKILSATENFVRPLNFLPASDLLLAPPVNVDDVALAVVNAVRDDGMFGIFTIDQIKQAAKNVKV
uniref:NAD-dependent epimerase/dehydratase domain-containing protein n=1 Tax=Chenopodium quinoa TaxID=63459 RepID=A0A803L663_CHEQI